MNGQLAPTDPRRQPQGSEIRVECPPPEQMRLRVAISPMATTIASLFEVVGGWRRGSDPQWTAAMRRRAGGIDLEPLALFGSDARTLIVPLVPVPARPAPRFEEELAAVAAAPEELVRREILSDFGDDVPREYRPWLEDPGACLPPYVASLRRWWEQVVAPEWPRMASILETEVLRVARLLATEGQRATLARVHPNFRWDGDDLVYLGGPFSRGRPLAGREVLLLPMACGPDGTLTDPNRGDVLYVAYGAPGAASLFETRANAPDALVAILGAGRAAVLRHLDGSSSMRSVALAVGLSASTVCTHLHALAEMELVAAGRLGRYVVYARTERGERLVELF